MVVIHTVQDVWLSLIWITITSAGLSHMNNSGEFQPPLPHNPRLLGPQEKQMISYKLNWDKVIPDYVFVNVWGGTSSRAPADGVKRSWIVLDGVFHMSLCYLFYINLTYSVIFPPFWLPPLKSSEFSGFNLISIISLLYGFF